MPTYKFRYFDVRARGEFIRFMFVLKGVDFEDSRFSFETWPAEKPNTPFGQLPVLSIDGVDYTESQATARFLAREFGFYGESNADGYEIDRMIGMWGDVLEGCVKYVFEKDEAVKAEKEKESKEKTARIVGNAEKILAGRETKGYTVGDKVSLGDAAVYDMVDGRFTDKELEDFPHINAIVKNFLANDKVKAYVEKTGKRPI